jgi:hypothetical protein
VARVRTSNKGALDFLLNVQKAALEEMIFFGNEFLDRLRVETQLSSEFSSKMARAHSVENLKTMYEECGQHQIDFVRRDSERLFKHGERMIETASRLFDIESKDRSALAAEKGKSNAPPRDDRDAIRASST